MKKLRKPCLSSGWYPRDPAAINGFLKKTEEKAAFSRNAAAAAAPHAGWYYSGAIAAAAVRALTDPAAGREGKAPDTIAVIGGHLPAGVPPLFAMEDAVQTPFGDMEIDAELRGILKADLDGAEDRLADNTVEVLLPMVRYFFPEAKLLWIRFPAETASFEAGKALAAAAGKLERQVKALASTDLTHYGPPYGFTPRGQGEKALEWVKTVNDRRFVEAVLAGVPETVIALAEKEKSACSAGAVLGALGFAAFQGSREACLLEYGTSADVSLEEGHLLPDSFVGYAAFAWF